MSNLEMAAEKRKLQREQNNESNVRMRMMKYDQDAVKLSKHEQKKLDRASFAGRVEEAQNVTSNSALGIY